MTLHPNEPQPWPATKRPTTLSNPHHEHSGESLREILDTHDTNLRWHHLARLFAVNPAGTFDELLHFVPHAFRYMRGPP